MPARAERLPLRLRAAVVLIAAAAICRVILGVTSSGDYQLGKPVGADNAAPAIDALIHGQLGALASHQPLMGLVSLIWRAPFSGPASWLGGSHELVYQLGVAACLLPALGAAWWLAGRAPSLQQWAAATAAAVLIAGGPITAAAAQVGHPEEVLTALLAAASVSAPATGRRRSAAVLLGLAVGTKPWALLAAPCVLLALPRSRATVATLAAAVAVPAAGLLPLLDPTAYGRAGRHIGLLNYANPWSLWWPTGGGRLAVPGVPAHHLPFSLTRTSATAIVFAMVAAGMWLYARHSAARAYGTRVDGLALLCALGLARCLADPAPVGYYFAALVIPLALWETGTRRRVPVLAGVVSFAVARFPDDIVAANVGHGPFGLTRLNLVWLVAGVALGIYLTRNAIRPRAKLDGAGQEEERASGWRGSPSSGIGSHGAA